MRVVVAKESLERCLSCGTHLENPFWDPNEGDGALVFPDWPAAVDWYFKEASDGWRRLRFLVVNRLVPMTMGQFKEKTAEIGRRFK